MELTDLGHLHQHDSNESDDENSAKPELAEHIVVADDDDEQNEEPDSAEQESEHQNSPLLGPKVKKHVARCAMFVRLTSAAILFAIAMLGVAAYLDGHESSKLAEWSAWKDFREACLQQAGDEPPKSKACLKSLVPPLPDPFDYAKAIDGGEWTQTFYSLDDIPRELQFCSQETRTVQAVLPIDQYPHVFGDRENFKPNGYQVAIYFWAYKMYRWGRYYPSYVLVDLEWPCYQCQWQEKQGPRSGEAVAYLEFSGCEPSMRFYNYQKSYNRSIPAMQADGGPPAQGVCKFLLGCFDPETGERVDLFAAKAPIKPTW